MGVKIKGKLKNLLYFLSVTAGKFQLRNIFSIFFKKNGNLHLSNGYILSFSTETKKDIVRLFLFSMINGVEFSNIDGFWSFDSDQNIIKTSSSIKFFIDNFGSVIFAETFLFGIHYDENLKNNIVITGGGFIGDTALYYASMGATVFCFEPDPINYRLAIRNISLNQELKNNIVLQNFAIGKDAIIDFSPGEGGIGGNSIYYTDINNSVKVRSVSITTILKELNITSPYLLDLDIKGYEYRVIDDPGISKFSKVRIEYNTEMSGIKLEGRQFLIDKLEELGFKIDRIYKHNCLPFDLNYHGTIEASKNILLPKRVY